MDFYLAFLSLEVNVRTVFSQDLASAAETGSLVSHFACKARQPALSAGNALRMQLCASVHKETTGVSSLCLSQCGNHTTED